MTPPADEVQMKIQKSQYYFSRSYIMNNIRKVVFLLVYLLINVGLGAMQIWKYRDWNYSMIIARICGMCLNFNCTFIVVLIMRYCLSWLRATPAAYFLPLDQSIFFHKMVGIVIFVQSVVHTLGHLGYIGRACVNKYSYNRDHVVK